MVRKPGRAGERRLQRRAAAEAELNEPRYEPPTAGECQVEEGIVYLAPDERFVHRVHYFDHRMVDFCLEIQVRERDTWWPVARIDCTHGHIHRHQLTRSGENDHQTVLCRLPSDDNHEAWKLVANQHELACADLDSKWDAYMKRWRQG